MKRDFSMHQLVLALLVGTIVPWHSAAAHGVWVAQRAGEWAVVLGENGADDAYKPTAVMQALGQTRDGMPALVEIRAQARNAMLDLAADVTTVAVDFEDGYWSQGADGKWVEGPRTRVPAARKAGYYRLFTRTVLAPGALPARPFGQPLEIVPLVDPMALRKGGSLRVQVLFQGKPLAGARLAGDYLNDGADHSIKTDVRGRALITVRNSGLNVIKVSHAVPRADRHEADEDGYTATLAFALPQPED